MHVNTFFKKCISGVLIAFSGLLIGVHAFGQTTTVDFEVPNPIQQTNLTDLLGAIASWVFIISIPIVVIIIIYAGLKFIMARGNEQAVSSAKNTLKWALIGLAIVLIGRGFIDLITDILSLGT